MGEHTRQGTAVILGGTSGIGRELAARLAADGMSVVISGRDADRAQSVAAEIGPTVRGIALDLAEPASIAAALSDVESVDHLVVAAIERDANGIKEYDVARATRLVTLKLVGYAEAVHVLHDRFTPSASIVLFGGLAMLRPYPGSTTVTTVNGGISSMVRTLASELAPVRVNALHPGIVGDSPEWKEKSLDLVVSRTPIGRTVTMDEIVGATLFLLDNGGVNAVNLMVDGGTMVR
ncbi:SDR family oxidoreductase [Longivirga aurantiaca]|uniref:SDR family oxidoreductase n=1 Tax=Longivirga aurantiaca TaxID=1837743 RepID=A0ABW1T2U1_9ACTN